MLSWWCVRALALACTVSPVSGCEYGCYCPASSVFAPLSDLGSNATSTCAALSGRTILFAGDSLMRDLWTTASLFLLRADGFDAQAMAGAHACMICAWEHLEPLGIRHALLHRGFLREDEPTMLACGKRVKLIYRFGRLFSDGAWISEAAASSKVDLLVVSHDILQMSEFPQAQVGVIRAWLKRFDAKTTVYMGAHARIAEKAPAKHFNEARWEQGNEKIRGWTAAARRGPLRVLDPYNLTAGLTPAYRDSYDGLHFGYFVNLQKFRMVLGALQLPSSSASV